MVLTATVVPTVYADSYDNQIKALQNKNTQSQLMQSQLTQEARNLQDKIAALEGEIAMLEQQINDSAAESQRLQAEIVRLQAELTYQRGVLGQNVRSMYIADDMGMMEKLASSKNLSDYVEQEEYRVRVQNQIKQTMARINKLEKQVANDKAKVDKELADQRAMQQQLNIQKAEKDRLLSLNTEQQAAENQAIQNNNALIAKLRKEQAAVNARGVVKAKAVSSGQHNGGYPDAWQNTPFPNELPDPWGMYKRQCVSYTAFKVAQSGRYMPYWGGRGDAKKWDDNARAAGIPVDTKPRVGDVAVSNAGTYGHVMYVEAVHDDGTISISQYNAGWTGTYSEARRSTAGLVFIHFP